MINPKIKLRNRLYFRILPVMTSAKAKTYSNEIMAALKEECINSLIDHGKIIIEGFGTLRVASSPARGKIPAGIAIRFVPTNKLKKSIKESKHGKRP